MPEKSPSGNIEDIPSEFFNALTQPQQSAQPINIPINVTTGANKGKTIKSKPVKKTLPTKTKTVSKT